MTRGGTSVEVPGVSALGIFTCNAGRGEREGLGRWIVNIFVWRVVKLDQMLFILLILCSLQSSSILKRKGLLGLSPLLLLKLNVDYLTVC